MKSIYLLIFLFLNANLFAQSKIKYKYRPFEFSIVPGFGTNGIDGGKYKNGIAFHVFTGYSGGNELFEFAGISNFNKSEVSGFQFAGFGNVIGGNALEFVKNRGEISLKDARYTAQLNGWQVAGFANVVTGNVRAWQIAGGFNINALNTIGWQIAGISNRSYGHTRGIQLAGFQNLTGKNMHGIQLAGFMNVVKKTLFGVQIAPINYAKTILGKSGQPSGKSGMQIGLLNIAKIMRGFQIGLINFASQSHGTHIGLLNVFSNRGKQNQVNGLSIGLLNIGDQFQVGFSTNETFLFNYELATGNSKNSLFRVKSFHNNNLNRITYSSNPTSSASQPKWGIGYEFSKYFFNASLYNDSQYFLNFGLSFTHLNWEKKLQKKLNLLTKLKAGGGFRLVKRMPFYLFGDLAVGMFSTENSERDFKGLLEIESFRHRGIANQLGIGYAVGILVKP